MCTIAVTVLLGAFKALITILLVIFLLGLDLRKRWLLRHVPGPPALPLLGNLPQILRLGSPTFFRQCRAKYGPVFKVAFGRMWVVVLADPELARQAGTKVLNHPAFRSLMRGEFRALDDLGLVAAKDGYWRLVRSAWQPAFSAPSLVGYLPRMAACAGALVDRLTAGAAAAAVKGEGGGASPRVDVWRELGSMTLQVVGSTAYGVDFQAIGGEDEQQQQQHDKEREQGHVHSAAPHSSSSPSPNRPQYGRLLVHACRDVFRYSSLMSGSKYSRLSLLFPELRPVIVPLAHAAPDKPIVALLKARTHLRDVCLELIRGWKATPRAGPHPPETRGDDASGPFTMKDTASNEHERPGGGGEREEVDKIPPPPPPPAAGAAIKEQGGGGTSGAGGGGGSGPAVGVESGSFLGLMLAARERGSGQGLTDLQVVAQVQTFILAGYETTANALAFAVYCIAMHPEVEARLTAEIDEVLGGDRLPTEADLPRLVYTEAVFQEALRLFPPAHVTNRELDAGALQVGGYTVPAGIPVFISLFSLHHNPDIWPRSEDFIPHRFLPTSPLYADVCARVPYAHAPFGYGSRLCIGWKFAVQEAKVALATLYQRLRFELEPGQVPLRTAVGITLSPKDGVWVRPVLRRSQ